MRYADRKVYQNKPSAGSLNKSILGTTIPNRKLIGAVLRSAIYQSEVVDG